ncbi:MAG: RnfH family protein [Xanthomonadales bacterium]|nr:RnfH family protein [Xanthomonadales bacterium]
MIDNSSCTVEVIFATLEQQKLIVIEVGSGTTIEQCIELSGILTEHPEINLQQNKVGVFSQIKSLDYQVQNGDRVEVYRSLIADPKVVRRQRAEQAKIKD